MKRASFGKKKWLAVLLVLAAVGWLVTRNMSPAPVQPVEIQPVGIASASPADVPEYYPAIGTVTPFNSVLVQSRVDGFLTAVHFVEGQKVREGDLLVEIDPRPFEIQLRQAEANLARDMALLKEARLDLERYRRLIKEESVSLQQLQSRESLAGQYEGAVMADEASIADARLQLTYSRVTAPVSGRLGLKNVDVGDMIRSSDTSGIVRITQTDPTYVVFTVVEKRIPDVLDAMRQQGAGMEAGEEPVESSAAEVRGLLVEAWDQQNTRLLASGRLLTLDNQIDTATGTVKAKALFKNSDDALFPNQFVNVRLLVRNLENVLVIPTSAVQRSNDGFFVFVVTPGDAEGQGGPTPAPTGVKNDSGVPVNATGRPVQYGKASVRNIIAGYATDAVTVVQEGLAPGDIVVTDGVDRLREGSPVSFTPQGMEEGEQGGKTTGQLP